MHFTGDVSIGAIVTILTILGVAVGLGQRLGRFETTVDTHAKTLTEHSSRLVQYEQQAIRFVGDLQRLVGRVETMMERRQGPRE